MRGHEKCIFNPHSFSSNSEIFLSFLKGRVNMICKGGNATQNSDTKARKKNVTQRKQKHQG